MNDMTNTAEVAYRDLDQLADWFLAIAPEIHAHEKHFPSVLHRLLLTGQPVAPSRLAIEAGASEAEVESFLRRWAMRNDDGRVFAFLGLTLQPTQHKLSVGQSAVFAWCAWDTLFLPELLDTDMGIESVCPQTGTTIQLSVSPGGIQSVRPAEAVVSFVTPRGLSCSGDDDCAVNPVVGARAVSEFCCHVHFLASPGAGEEWIARNPGVFLLSLENAFRLGRLTNRGLLNGTRRS